jgi:hypothetical protein
MADRTPHPTPRCRFDRQRRCFLVRSSSGTRVYELTARGLNGLLVVSCTCPAGIKGRQVPAGATKCRHAAAVARRLARAGLVRLEGVSWVVTAKAERLSLSAAA